MLSAQGSNVASKTTEPFSSSFLDSEEAVDIQQVSGPSLLFSACLTIGMPVFAHVDRVGILLVCSKPRNLC